VIGIQEIGRVREHSGDESKRHNETGDPSPLVSSSPTMEIRELSDIIMLFVGSTSGPTWA
jgi:hypothetical protein